MKLKTLSQVTALLLSMTPALTWAWGADGHQQVGEIADQLIAGTPAQQAVHQILGDLTLKQVAVWADCVKSVNTVDDVHFSYNDPYNRKECTAFLAPEERSAMLSYVGRNWRQCGSAAGNELCHNQFHYTDVSNLRDHYDPHFAGTSDHDVVHAINAAIDVLRGRAPTPPFNINTKREALMLLAHFVGDLHQPLHVSAVYLDPQGHVVDPDGAGGMLAHSDTAGGNFIQTEKSNLHSIWDAPISASAGPAGSVPALTNLARAVAPSTGAIEQWSTQWATEAIQVSTGVFQGLQFSAPAACPCAPKANTGKWSVTGLDTTYLTREDQIKIQQISRAGARLAQILTSIWPDAHAIDTSPVIAWQGAGYLNGVATEIETWLPPAPKLNSATDRADLDTVRTLRTVLASPRGMVAARDDVYQPQELAARFSEAAGIDLTPSLTPTLMKIIAYIEADAEAMVKPVKRKVADGGRQRPFVRDPKLASCIAPKDMAGRHDIDMSFGLDKSGSYPSTHALIGLATAMVLAEALPDRNAPLIERGVAFGDSRVICGFHYPSDVSGGRVAAAALMARLHANPIFQGDMIGLKMELTRNLPTTTH